MKLVIVGGGSSYTPELIASLAKFQKKLPITEVFLTDVNPQRLDILYGFSKRMVEHAGLPIAVKASINRQEALQGAAFVNCLIRVGGMPARINDERIPLKYGVVGQETTGPGGMMKALRTIPVIMGIVKEMEAVCPTAWLINYTNPSGIVAEALGTQNTVKWVGLCSGPNSWIKAILTAMKVDPKRANVDWIGLNHLGFATRILVDGVDVTSQAIDIVAHNWSINEDWLRTLGFIPASYLHYYYHRNKVINESKEPNYQTRGEQVLKIEQELLMQYSDTNLVRKPALLKKRGGEGYADSAFNAMSAIYNNSGDRQILQVINNGAIDGLPERASVEVPCLVDQNGASPLRIGEIPLPIRGIIQAVKCYESLAVQAALQGSRRLALQALMNHPLVSDWEIAEPMLNEMLEANRSWIPWG